MLRVNGIVLKPGESKDSVVPQLCRILRVSPAELIRWRISKESVDARQ